MKRAKQPPAELSQSAINKLKTDMSDFARSPKKASSGVNKILDQISEEIKLARSNGAGWLMISRFIEERSGIKIPANKIRTHFTEKPDSTTSVPIAMPLDPQG